LVATAKFLVAATKNLCVVPNFVAEKKIREENLTDVAWILSKIGQGAYHNDTAMTLFSSPH